MAQRRVTMTNAGLDRAECEAAIAAMEGNPVFLAARKVQQLQTKYQFVDPTIRNW